MTSTGANAPARRDRGQLERPAAHKLTNPTTDFLPLPERWLSTRDGILAKVIMSQEARWPARATEDPVWGLLRIVMAQHLSTTMACRLAQRVKAVYPTLGTTSHTTRLDMERLCAIGLSKQRAQCCVAIEWNSKQILADVACGRAWEDVLRGIKGIGPWTVAVFRIMILREPDVFPLHDVGLERAVAIVYGTTSGIEHIVENWRPYRSVASWYLWRTLGNEQLG